jgi:hypothetical protein
MALFAGAGVGSIGEIMPAGMRLRNLMAEAEGLLAATDVADVPASASGVCYAGEMSGVYMGTLEPDELAAALRDTAADLLQVLRGTLDEARAGRFDTPPFAASTYPLAAWTLTLLRLAGGTRSFGTAAHPADPPGLVRRLGELLPLMPDGAPRETLLALRRVLEERSAAQILRTFQLSLTS